jgi:16S rRNA C967 or C1407 C5-methylase (RsmB/RsmF family)
LNIRVSFPQFLFEKIEKSWKEECLAVCYACNAPAPLVLRVNRLKTTKQELIRRLLASNIEAKELEDDAIYLPRRINFCVLPEFSEGLFEVQDLGSQCVAHCVQAIPGQSVLDYCAGSGGKSLAIAVTLENKGQLFLHDIRQKALLEAKKRLRRAGVGNAQIVSHLPRLKGRMDWVLTDVPCSGSGTLRRNPDMKWKITEELLQRLVAEQRQIFAEALIFLKPKGHIVYATCSLLREENDEQVDYFLSHHPLKLDRIFRSAPHISPMDGFFAAVFHKDCSSTTT